MKKLNMKGKGIFADSRLAAWTGSACAMASAVIFGLNPLVAKNAYEGGSNGVTLVFSSALTAIPVLIVMLKLSGQPLVPGRKALGSALLIGMCNAVTTILLFTSYNYVATGIATTIHFSYPALTAVGAVLFFREKLTGKKILALFISLAGIVLAADFSGTANMTGIAIAFISGVTYASYILILDHSSLKTQGNLVICLYMMVSKVAAAGIFGLAAGNLNLHLTGKAWVFTVIMGIVMGIGGTMLFQFGVRFAGGCNAALFSMLEPVTSLVIGFLVMGETMSALKMLGCILILAGIVLTND